MRSSNYEKRVGRFIKKNSKISEVVKVQKYSFEEICEADIAETDNPNQNVIHSRLHDPKNLEKKLKKAEGFDNQAELAQALPIIFPRNFTQDWLEAKRRSKRRDETNPENEYDDDDDDDDDQVGERRKPNVTREEEKKSDPLHVKEILGESSRSERILGDIKSASDRFDEVKNLAGTVDIPETTTEPLVIKKEEKFTQDREDKKSEVSEDFVQDIREELDAVTDSKEFEEAQKEQVEKVAESLRMAEKIAEDLKGLKRAIMESAQDNFMQILTAMSESIFEMKMSHDPKVLGLFIKKAISEAVTDDKFSIALNSEGAKLFQEHSPELASLIQIDDKLEFGKFIIKTQMSQVEGNLKETLKDFIRQNNLNLFEDKE